MLNDRPQETLSWMKLLVRDPEYPLSEPGASDEGSYPLVGSADPRRPPGLDDDAWLPGHGENPLV